MKDPAKNVEKLIAAQHPKRKPKATDATLHKRLKPIKKAASKVKGEPKNVLKLIADATKRKSR